MCPILIPSKKKILDELVLQGESVQFIVYDLIPLLYPQFFPKGTQEQFKLWFSTVSNYQKLICISKSTEVDVRSWLSAFYPKRLETLDIGNFQLADSIPSDDFSYGYPKNAGRILSIAKESRLFIMVGTLEPRKGHLQVFEAFNSMWEKGEGYVLLIIGKKGGSVEELAKKIESNKFYEKNLFWLKDCSDEFLLRLYHIARGLIAASYAEGYGLPIVESKNFGMSVFARDIPVFREINETSNNIYFFSATTALQLEQQFIEWTTNLPNVKPLKSFNSEVKCWENATKELQKIIFDNS